MQGTDYSFLRHKTTVKHMWRSEYALFREYLTKKKSVCTTLSSCYTDKEFRLNMHLFVLNIEQL